ncbi:hypothetical protein DIPPA_25773 [Diplonema papillatum]|nr:hypothetical protein DIPPA_25773 [Diplonema papillatum]
MPGAAAGAMDENLSDVSSVPASGCEYVALTPARVAAAVEVGASSVGSSSDEDDGWILRSTPAVAKAYGRSSAAGLRSAALAGRASHNNKFKREDTDKPPVPEEYTLAPTPRTQASDRGFESDASSALVAQASNWRVSTITPRVQILEWWPARSPAASPAHHAARPGHRWTDQSSDTISTPLATPRSDARRRDLSAGAAARERKAGGRVPKTPADRPAAATPTAASSRLTPRSAGGGGVGLQRPRGPSRAAPRPPGDGGLPGPRVGPGSTGFGGVPERVASPGSAVGGVRPSAGRAASPLAGARGSRAARGGYDGNASVCSSSVGSSVTTAKRPAYAPRGSPRSAAAAKPFAKGGWNKDSRDAKDRGEAPPAGESPAGTPTAAGSKSRGSAGIAFPKTLRKTKPEYLVASIQSLEASLTNQPPPAGGAVDQPPVVPPREAEQLSFESPPPPSPRGRGLARAASSESAASRAQQDAGQPSPGKRGQVVVAGRSHRAQPPSEVSKANRGAGHKAAPAEPGARKTEPAEPGTRNTEPAKPGARNTEPAEPGTRKTEPAEPGARKTEPAEPGARKAEPAEPGTRKAVPGELDFRKPVPAEPGTQRAPPLVSGTRRGPASEGNATPRSGRPGHRRGDDGGASPPHSTESCASEQAREQRSGESASSGGPQYPSIEAREPGEGPDPPHPRALGESDEPGRGADQKPLGGRRQSSASSSRQPEGSLSTHSSSGSPGRRRRPPARRPAAADGSRNFVAHDGTVIFHPAAVVRERRRVLGAASPAARGARSQKEGRGPAPGQRAPAAQSDGRQQQDAPSDRLDSQRCQNVPSDRLDSQRCQNAPSDKSDNQRYQNVPSDRLDSQRCQNVPSDQSDNQRHQNAPSDKSDNQRYQNVPSDQSDNQRYQNVPSDQSDNQRYQNVPSDKSDNQRHQNAPSDQSDNQRYQNVPSDQSDNQRYQNVPSDQSDNQRYQNAPSDQSDNQRYQNAPSDQSDNQRYENAPSDQSNNQDHHHAPTNQSDNQQYQHATSTMPVNRESIAKPAAPGANPRPASNASEGAVGGEQAEEVATGDPAIRLLFPTTLASNDAACPSGKTTPRSLQTDSTRPESDGPTAQRGAPDQAERAATSRGSFRRGYKKRSLPGHDARSLSDAESGGVRRTSASHGHEGPDSRRVTDEAASKRSLPGEVTEPSERSLCSVESGRRRGSASHSHTRALPAEQAETGATTTRRPSRTTDDTAGGANPGKSQASTKNPSGRHTPSCEDALSSCTKSSLVPGAGAAENDARADVDSAAKSGSAADRDRGSECWSPEDAATSQKLSSKTKSTEGGEGASIVSRPESAYRSIRSREEGERRATGDVRDLASLPHREHGDGVPRKEVFTNQTSSSNATSQREREIGASEESRGEEEPSAASIASADISESVTDITRDKEGGVQDEEYSYQEEEEEQEEWEEQLDEEEPQPTEALGSSEAGQFPGEPQGDISAHSVSFSSTRSNTKSGDHTADRIDAFNVVNERDLTARRRRLSSGDASGRRAVLQQPDLARQQTELVSCVSGSVMPPAGRQQTDLVSCVSGLGMRDSSRQQTELATCVEYPSSVETVPTSRGGQDPEVSMQGDTVLDGNLMDEKGTVHGFVSEEDYTGYDVRSSAKSESGRDAAPVGRSTGGKRGHRRPMPPKGQGYALRSDEGNSSLDNQRPRRLPSEPSEVSVRSALASAFGRPPRDDRLRSGLLSRSDDNAAAARRSPSPDHCSPATSKHTSSSGTQPSSPLRCPEADAAFELVSIMANRAPDDTDKLQLHECLRRLRRSSNECDVQIDIMKNAVRQEPHEHDSEDTYPEEARRLILEEATRAVEDLLGCPAADKESDEGVARSVSPPGSADGDAPRWAHPPQGSAASGEVLSLSPLSTQAAHPALLPLPARAAFDGDAATSPSPTFSAQEEARHVHRGSRSPSHRTVPRGRVSAGSVSEGSAFMSSSSAVYSKSPRHSAGWLRAPAPSVAELEADERRFVGEEEACHVARILNEMHSALLRLILDGNRASPPRNSPAANPAAAVQSPERGWAEDSPIATEKNKTSQSPFSDYYNNAEVYEGRRNPCTQLDANVVHDRSVTPPLSLRYAAEKPGRDALLSNSPALSDYYRNMEEYERMKQPSPGRGAAPRADEAPGTSPMSLPSDPAQRNLRRLLQAYPSEDGFFAAARDVGGGGGGARELSGTPRTGSSRDDSFYYSSSRNVRSMERTVPLAIMPPMGSSASPDSRRVGRDPIPHGASDLRGKTPPRKASPARSRSASSPGSSGQVSPRLRPKAALPAVRHGAKDLRGKTPPRRTPDTIKGGSPPPRSVSPGVVLPASALRGRHSGSPPSPAASPHRARLGVLFTEDAPSRLSQEADGARRLDLSGHSSSRSTSPLSRGQDGPEGKGEKWKELVSDLHRASRGPVRRIFEQMQTEQDGVRCERRREYMSSLKRELEAAAVKDSDPLPTPPAPALLKKLRQRERPTKRPRAMGTTVTNVPPSSASGYPAAIPIWTTGEGFRGLGDLGYSTFTASPPLHPAPFTRSTPGTFPKSQ